MSAKLESFSLIIPVTFSPNSSQGKGKANTDLVEQSFSAASPSCIICWESQRASSGSISKHTTASVQGVVVGCKDGSLFILRSTGYNGTVPAVPSISIPPESVSSPSGSRRYLALGPTPSRAGSPSSTKSSLSPFHVTRSRIVSGVSNEQVEAPKNYVDFDEEQEKLKGMLKGKNHRDRNACVSRSRSEKDFAPAEKASIAQSIIPQGSSLRKDDTRSYLSAAFSPTASTLSLPLSSPPSPTLVPAASPELATLAVLGLRCHVFPLYAGPGHSVSSIKLHDGGSYISCLNERGGLSLHSTVDGACIASTVVEAKPRLVSQGERSQASHSMFWVWKTLIVVPSDESTILFACASPDEFYPAGQPTDSNTGDPDNQSILAAYELSFGPRVQEGEVKLEYRGQWSILGPANSIGLRAGADHSSTLFYANASGHLVSQVLQVHDTSPIPSTDVPQSHSSTHLPLPNPFKTLKSLSTDHLPDTPRSKPTDRIEFGKELDYGNIGLTEPLLGLRAHDGGESVRLCAWSASEVTVLNWVHRTFERSPIIMVSGIRDVKWIDHNSFSVLFSDHSENYRVILEVDKGEGNRIRIDLGCNFPLVPGSTAALIPGGHIVSTRVKHGSRRIYYTPPDSPGENGSAKTLTLWKARRDTCTSLAVRSVTCLLSHELDSIIVGHSDGHVSCSSLLNTISGTSNSQQTSDIPLSAGIITLDVVDNVRTGERLLIGGADDGTIGIWSQTTLKLCAKWTVFITPLARVISLHDEKVGRLRECILCVSQDGTIAVIALDGYQFIYLVPASAAPLKGICLRENNLLLLYGDGRARLWDTRTREFWRSMSVEKAEELMQEDDWLQWPIGTQVEKRSVVFDLSPHTSPDAASTLSVDLSALLRQFASSAALTGTNAPIATKARLDHARTLLSLLLTFGISESIDSICIEGLSITPRLASIGLARAGCFSLIPQLSSAGSWSVSPNVSTDRALALLSTLQYLTQYEDLAQDANTVMTFYAASVGQLVSESYQPPSLPRLGNYLLHTHCPEVRHAARLLFDAGVARLPDQEITRIVEYWQECLPASLVEDKDSTRSALALCICGSIAVDKYSLLPSSTLTDIAKSIAGYLHDELSPHRSLAIDLCSRGFQVWQQHVDAVEMLRALCILATTTKKEAILVQNIGAQARSAVLQIAASNTPLFMTTLALDILQPRSVEHRKSVMQLVIFLIRKKPLVLYSNLPRLVEAIVKSLDPNSNSTREAVFDSATEILSHIVQTFPTVDFHMGTQRLAVGTSEGAVVMYDLKTATRLYVLEGHKKRTTACSFSPDGRRLVTLSLEESDVLVWKVGSSFTSFFMPGVPPRQGHSGSEPFKTLSFNIGDEANMSLESTLVDVHFEWTADRSVKLKIRDIVLTFST